MPSTRAGRDMLPMQHMEEAVANFELLKGYYRISINNIAGDPITRLWVQPQAQILKLKALVEQVNGARLLQQRYYSDSGEELLAVND